MTPKRQTCLVTVPHTINMGTTTKGAMHRATTPHLVGAQFIAPECTTANLRGLGYGG